MEESTHETKTRGPRSLHGARPAGEALYELVQTSKGIHFWYRLEVPKELHDTQHAFNITQSASFIVTVKNPIDPEAQGSSGAVHGDSEEETTKDKRIPKTKPVELPPELMEVSSSHMMTF